MRSWQHVTVTESCLQVQYSKERFIMYHLKDPALTDSERERERERFYFYFLNQANKQKQGNRLWLAWQTFIITISNLAFYAQSTSAVMLGQTQDRGCTHTHTQWKRTHKHVPKRTHILLKRTAKKGEKERGIHIYTGFSHNTPCRMELMFANSIKWEVMSLFVHHLFFPLWKENLYHTRMKAHNTYCEPTPLNSTCFINLNLSHASPGCQCICE